MMIVFSFNTPFFKFFFYKALNKAGQLRREVNDKVFIGCFSKENQKTDPV